MSGVVWLWIVFDLPAATSAEKKAHTRYRKLLLRHGFQRLQWSVYARAYPSEAASEGVRRILRAQIPHAGRVRMLAVTDRQFERMQVFDGLARKEPEKTMPALLLFD